MNNLERIKTNVHQWLAGAGEVEILLLLDCIAEELEARGRPFPAEIPCFGTFGFHQGPSIHELRRKDPPLVRHLEI